MVVCLTTGVGLGFPDAILGWRGQTYLLELKSPGGALRGSQIMWLAAWKGGPVIHAETLSDVLHALGIAAT